MIEKLHIMHDRYSKPTLGHVKWTDQIRDLH
jgi:hypothetical protein